MEAKQVVPPYKPRIESDRDLEHFDPSFTTEPVVLTPDDPKMLADIDQGEFDGFEYVNPLLMSLEDCVWVPIYTNISCTIYFLGWSINFKVLTRVGIIWN